MIEITTKTEMRTMFRAFEKYRNKLKTSNLQCINDFYKSPSQAKLDAWEYCRELKNKYNGINLTVISGNSHLFTAGFMFVKDNFYFVYTTKSHDWCCKVHKLLEYGGKHENI